MIQMVPEFLPEIIATLIHSTKMAVLTGAGISAESGVPTFREAQTGLWALYDPQELATANAFQRDPRLVWEWYQWRREIVRQALPNPAHFTLVDFARRVPRFTLITQNVDGLHQQAGSPGVIELHGNIFRTICFEARHPVETWLESSQIPPACPVCGSLLRPDVVWFGEALPEEALNAAWQAVGSCDVFLSVGTSTMVEPAALLPYYARERGAVVIEINPQQTPLSKFANYSLHGPAGVILPALFHAAWGES
jgi:NAD-dependent deacetylase